MTQHGVRFGPGRVVGPGEYRNTETGAIRYFDGNTPIPGGVNAAAWEQVSDHYHAQLPAEGGISGETRPNPERPSRPVAFSPGTVVSPGEYRNTATGATRYFDGNTALPGGANASSWQQVSDHFHAQAAEAGGGGHRGNPEEHSHPVAFAPGTVVSPGEYRNTQTGATRYFDGNTPLPGGVNAASWVQISDHYHATDAEMHPAPRG
jgi:hypothetical protein